MAKSYAKSKGRKSVSHYITFPQACLLHENFKALSGHACRMLMELASQFNGYNNGDLQASWTDLHKLGWKSRDTTWKALTELTDYGWILKTRQGGKNRCNLYAITFLPINGNKKLDYPYSEHGKKYPGPNMWRNGPDGN